MNFHTLQSIKPLFVVNKTGNEVILVPLASNINQMTEIFVMNETAGFIWEQLDKTRDQTELAGKIADYFDVSLERAENDLVVFFEKIAGLIDTYQL